MRTLGVILGFGLIASTGAAQSSAAFDSIVISCNSAPQDARTEIPAELAQWATLSCTRFGHVIRAKNGWVWHNPRKNHFVRIWAQHSDGKFVESGHESYFKELEFRQLSASETDSANAALAA